MDCFAYYLMGMVAAHFEILHSHIQCIGSNIHEDGHCNMEEVEFTRLSIELCVQEHQQLLECENIDSIDDFIL